jgi:hypothetical protein
MGPRGKIPGQKLNKQSIKKMMQDKIALTS